MKRTEKIEVRVSHEEKQTLTNLAKQDGESVSGLVRGLIDKYIALNSANTKRRLPKWQMAAMLVAAALVGHGLTLIPMKLHGHGGSQEALAPVYYVHGAIDNSAFGVSVYRDDPPKVIHLEGKDDTLITVRLAFLASADETGKLKVLACAGSPDEPCVEIFDSEMDVGRVEPSVLGGQTKDGQPVNIFVQEMA